MRHSERAQRRARTDNPDVRGDTPAQLADVTEQQKRNIISVLYLAEQIYKRFLYAAYVHIVVDNQDFFHSNVLSIRR